ncbi:MAG TPA: cation:proton antiporter [Blastocatellia bacterium]|nr:cation:proton antiporter [Blastocatellia bacterium]
MHQDLTVLQDVLLILVLSIPIVFLFNKLRQPVLVGFIAAGIAIGPHGLGIIQSSEHVTFLAEIGVALLLFTIGLEFSLGKMMRSARVVVAGGGLQVLVTVLATIGVAVALGWKANAATFAGFLIALSSTAIVLKTYQDRAEVDAPHGRAAVGVLIFQDLCIVPMMILVPVLSGSTGGSAVAIALTLGRAALAIVGVLLAARIVVPRILKYVVSLRSPEVFVISVVTISLGTAVISSYLGLSLALGAFIAGLVVSESEYSHQVVADILPFRHVFNGLFFVSIGMLLSLSALWENVATVAGLTLGIVVVKAAIVTCVMLALGLSVRTAVMAGLGLAQVGEFSLVLATAGVDEGLLTPNRSQIFLAATIISMVATPFLIRIAPGVGTRIAAVVARGRQVPEPEPAAGPMCKLADHAIVVGFGLGGQNLAKVLASVAVPFCVVEMNAVPDRRAAVGEPPEQMIYGDATRREVLHEAGIDCARMLVVMISDPSALRSIVANARALAPHLQIIVRSRYVSELPELMGLGANQVVAEDYQASLEMVERVMSEYGVKPHAETPDA